MNPERLPLRDIHLPDPVSWWPPAPGWWVVTLLIVATGMYLAIRGWLQRTRLQRRVRRELSRIEARFDASGDTSQLLADLSTLLRRVALSRDENRSVSSLSGSAWLRWLDQGLVTPDFSEGPGAALADGPYRRPDDLPADADAQALLSLCRRKLMAMAA